MILTINCLFPIEDHLVGVCSRNVTCVAAYENYIFIYISEIWLSSDKESKMGIQHA
jgi:hypothetical protein